MVLIRVFLNTGYIFTYGLFYTVFSYAKYILLFQLVVVVTHNVHAQALPAVTPDRTKAQQPIVSPSLKNEKKTEKLDLPKVQSDIDTAPGSGSIYLKKIVFEGGSVFPSAELEKLTADYLNRWVRAADIEAIRRKVSQYYIDHGYINSGAILESQSLADGALKLKLIEGKLTEVRQTGQERLQESYIRDRLLVGSGDPLNVEELQDSYRLLLADPLIKQLNGQLLPGAHLGEAILDVNVTRARPYQLYFGADDYQTPAVGGYTGRIGGWVDNLLTLGERIDAQFIANGGALGYNTGINLPLNARGTRFGFSYTDTNSTIVEQPLDVLNITNHITGFDGGLTQTVYRTFADDISLGINFAVRQNKTLLENQCVPVDGIGINSCETQVSVLRMSQRASHKADSNSLVLWSTFSVGLDVLGATTNQPGLQSGEFFSWLGQGMFSQNIWDTGALLVVKGNIQLADKPLLNLERYAVGGVYTVRGYRENTYVRDNGFNANLELHYPLLTSLMSGNNNLFLVPFLDYGGAWNNDTSIISDQKADYLFSAGIGFTWQFYNVNTEFYWANAFNPVMNSPNTERNIQDDGIHFRVNINAF
jgi:hemolysin activation/secretion protein